MEGIGRLEYVCVCICIQVVVFICDFCALAYMNMRSQVSACTCEYIYICVYIYICMHAYSFVIYMSAHTFLGHARAYKCVYTYASLHKDLTRLDAERERERGRETDRETESEKDREREREREREHVAGCTVFCRDRRSSYVSSWASRVGRSKQSVL